MLQTVLKKPATASWREARRQNARAALLASAWEMVREDGLAALSLRELARRAGITTPTVYAYFESKNAIFDAMFGEAAQSFADLKAEMPLSDDPRHDLQAETKAFVEFCTSDVARYQLFTRRFRTSERGRGGTRARPESVLGSRRGFGSARISV
jgi:AcrR family transcriptional regulator